MDRVGAEIRCCLDRPAWALSDNELVDAVDAVHALQQRLAALHLRLVREVGGRAVARTHGATSTTVWLRNRHRLSTPAARRLVTLATTLDTAPPAVADALARGLLTTDQARTILDVLTALPNHLGAEAIDKAVQLLIDWAAQFEPAILRTLGNRILDHVAPDLADEADRAALHTAETRAHDRRHLTLSTQPTGQVTLTGLLDAETAAVLHAALDPLTTPTGPGDSRSPGQRRADALGDICRLALHTGTLPDNGGDRPQVVVTTSFDTLAGQLGTGTLDTGLRLTPEAVRRLACDATILPAVLGGTSQVLDVGRQRRLFTGPLRRALVLRDGGCAFPGCDRPPRWCDGHHIRHWADGGTTDLANAVLLCDHHHRLIHHDSDWTVHLGPDGHPEFTPPAWLDPTRLPRRNHYHHRA
ncbi:HNH endonuclease signature motif containing protein [Micromonospora zhanjiangensis]